MAGQILPIQQMPPVSEMNWKCSQELIHRLSERPESIEELLRRRGFFDARESTTQNK